MIDETRLRRSLRLDAGERAQLDIHGLAAAAAEQEARSLARLALLGVAACAAIPAGVLVRVVAAVLAAPSADPLGIATAAAVPLGESLFDLITRPVLPIALVAAAIVLGALERGEHAHATAART